MMDAKRFTEANAVFLWQGDPHTHPLTCGNDSDHKLTYDLLMDRGLYCPECEWQQDVVPQAVIDRLYGVANLLPDGAKEQACDD